MKSMIFIGLLLIAAPSLAHEHSRPPELWSSFKDLNKPKEICELQSAFILRKLHLENQVQNQYGIYGNIKSNRVVVKCIAMTDSKSKLLVAVAGFNRRAVERVRNTIINAIE